MGIHETGHEHAALGFDKGPGIDSESHGFGSSAKVGINATAGADLFLGLDAEITLAGKIGVGGDLGRRSARAYYDTPYLAAELSPSVRGFRSIPVQGVPPRVREERRDKRASGACSSWRRQLTLRIIRI